MKQNAQKGTWLFGPQTLDLVWVGAAPAPVPTVAERIRFALAHIRSKGYDQAAGKGNRFLPETLAGVRVRKRICHYRPVRASRS